MLAKRQASSHAVGRRKQTGLFSNQKPATSNLFQCIYRLGKSRKRRSCQNRAFSGQKVHFGANFVFATCWFSQNRGLNSLRFPCFALITPSDVGRTPPMLGEPLRCWNNPLFCKNENIENYRFWNVKKKNNRPHRIVWGVATSVATNPRANHAEHPYYRAT